MVIVCQFRQTVDIIRRTLWWTLEHGQIIIFTCKSNIQNPHAFVIIQQIKTVLLFQQFKLLLLHCHTAVSPERPLYAYSPAATRSWLHHSVSFLCKGSEIGIGVSIIRLSRITCNAGYRWIKHKMLKLRISKTLVQIIAAFRLDIYDIIYIDHVLTIYKCFMIDPCTVYQNTHAYSFRVQSPAKLLNLFLIRDIHTVIPYIFRRKTGKDFCNSGITFAASS